MFGVYDFKSNDCRLVNHVGICKGFCNLEIISYCDGEERNKIYIKGHDRIEMFQLSTALNGDILLSQEVTVYEFGKEVLVDWCLQRNEYEGSAYIFTFTHGKIYMINLETDNYECIHETSPHCQYIYISSMSHAFDIKLYAVDACHSITNFVISKGMAQIQNDVYFDIKTDNTLRGFAMLSLGR